MIGTYEEKNGYLARSGKSYTGNEREAGERADNFEYIVPLALGLKRYALEVDHDGAVLRARVGALRGKTLWLMLAALLLAVPVFSLLGGRGLTRQHSAAVGRATRDGLTELGNQTEFQEELGRATALAARYGESLSLALVDLDDFKLANDRNGHRHGDRLLVGLAGLLRSDRPQDRAFRIGGDEFALILPRTDSAGAAARLERVRAAAIGQLEGVTLSGGVAELDPAAPDADTAVEEADAALYEGKRRGRDRVVRFSELDGAMLVTRSRSRALHDLLAGTPPEVAFQPIWELGEERNRIVGYEALARPDAGHALSVGEAFEIAERTGRAHDLDALCRRGTLARAHDLPEGALLFMNVAPQSLDQDELAGDALLRSVCFAGLTPDQVVLEITERSSARLDRVVREATRLRGLGFKLALDDVGAGNAGLEMLRTLTVDFIKIDRAVIADSCVGGSARAVLHAVTSFAAEMGAFVIAEGIETEAMLDHVRIPPRREDSSHRIGVQGVQGYLLGRPSPVLPSAAAEPDRMAAAWSPGRAGA